jgi:hypothetical protein
MRAMQPVGGAWRIAARLRATKTALPQRGRERGRIPQAGETIIRYLAILIIGLVSTYDTVLTHITAEELIVECSIGDRDQETYSATRDKTAEPAQSKTAIDRFPH